MTINFEGKTLELKQDAYIDGIAGETPYYRALATDQQGNEYNVTWEVVENWEQIEDETEMVENWDAPWNVTAI